MRTGWFVQGADSFNGSIPQCHKVAVRLTKALAKISTIFKTTNPLIPIFLTTFSPQKWWLFSACQFFLARHLPFNIALVCRQAGIIWSSASRKLSVNQDYLANV
jgi:hypothetical protein